MKDVKVSIPSNIIDYLNDKYSSYNWIAKDSDGAVFLYMNKPAMGVHAWKDNDGCVPVDNLFVFYKEAETILRDCFSGVEWKDSLTHL